MKQCILITGSAGFIGFSTARALLKRGVKVVGIDNFNSYYDPNLKLSRSKILKKYDNFTEYEVDIIDQKALEKIIKDEKVTIICHLAAQAGVGHSLTHPFDYTKTNIEGFLSVLEAVRKSGIKHIVYASSSSVYGNNPLPEKGFSEQDTVNTPISLYAATKRANELMAYTYHHLYGMYTTGLRFFTVYGPWGRPDMALFKFVDSILKDQPINVNNYGNMRRNFTYIDDIVDGIIAALDHCSGYHIINLGNSKSESLMDFIHEIEKNLGKKAMIQLLPMQPGDVPETFAHLEHAKQTLKFTPRISINKGIPRFIRWYKKYYHV